MPNPWLPGCWQNLVSKKLMTKPLMILIAGPYRSGTGDDPSRMAAKVHYMESFALPIFRLGHLPLLGGWLAFPLLHLAGSREAGDDSYREIFHPVAERLLEKCDAVLRVGGESSGADQMVEIARQNGLKIYTKLEQIPSAG